MNGRGSSNDNALSGEGLIRRKLQYAKTKSKLAEFSTPSEEYPEFKYDSDDLCFNAMHALSSYADAKLQSAMPNEDARRKLKEAASFYDAASTEEDHTQFSDGFILLVRELWLCGSCFRTCERLALLRRNGCKILFSRAVFA